MKISNAFRGAARVSMAAAKAFQTWAEGREQNNRLQDELEELYEECARLEGIVKDGKAQLKDLATRLAREQEVTETLRLQVRQLQQKVVDLEIVISNLRDQARSAQLANQ